MAAYESCDPQIGDRRVPVTDEKEIPYSGVAHLVINTPGKHVKATGFIVNLDGTFLILTAAHNLYDTKKGKCDTVYIYLGRHHEVLPHGVITKEACDIAVPEGHKKGKSGFDYGIILLENSEYDFEKLHYFLLRDPDVYKMWGSNLYMNGYPNSVEGRDTVQMKCLLTNPKKGYQCIYYKDATSPGNSGSPIYAIQDDKPIAIGIHCEGFIDEIRYNKATLISQAVISDIEQMIPRVKIQLLKNNSKRHNVTVIERTFVSFGQKGHLRRSNSLWSVSKIKDGWYRFGDYSASTIGLPSRINEVLFEHDEHYNREQKRSTSETDISTASMRPFLPKDTGMFGTHSNTHAGWMRKDPTSVLPENVEVNLEGITDATVSCGSNLLFPPKVKRKSGNLMNLQDFLSEDKLNIFPDDDVLTSSVTATFVKTLKQLTDTGTVLITSSLCELMHISFNEDQPSDILFEAFGVIPGFAPFVLIITNTVGRGTHVESYSAHLTQNIVDTVRKFTDEIVSSTYGRLIPSDFQTPGGFQKKLDSIMQTSRRFCNPYSLLMDKVKWYNVSRACLIAMAVTETIPDTCEPVELTLGTKDDLRRHFTIMKWKRDELPSLLKTTYNQLPPDSLNTVNKPCVQGNPLTMESTSAGTGTVVEPKEPSHTGTVVRPVAPRTGTVVGTTAPLHIRTVDGPTELSHTGTVDGPTDPSHTGTVDGPVAPHTGTVVGPTEPSHTGTVDGPVAPHTGTVVGPTEPSHTGTFVGLTEPSHTGTFDGPVAPHTGTVVGPTEPSHTGTVDGPVAPHTGSVVRPTEPSHTGTVVRPLVSPHTGSVVRPTEPSHTGTVVRPVVSPHTGSVVGLEEPTTKAFTKTKDAVSVTKITTSNQKHSDRTITSITPADTGSVVTATKPPQVYTLSTTIPTCIGKPITSLTPMHATSSIKPPVPPKKLISTGMAFTAASPTSSRIYIPSTMQSDMDVAVTSPISDHGDMSIPKTTLTQTCSKVTHSLSATEITAKLQTHAGEASLVYAKPPIPSNNLISTSITFTSTPPTHTGTHVTPKANAATHTVTTANSTSPTEIKTDFSARAPIHSGTVVTTTTPALLSTEVKSTEKRTIYKPLVFTPIPFTNVKSTYRSVSASTSTNTPESNQTKPLADK